MVIPDLSIYFNLREPRAKTSLIYMILRWDGRPLVYPTKKRVSTKDWNIPSKKSRSADQYIKRSSSQYDEIDSALMELKSDARKLYSQFSISEERPPTLEEMRYMLNEKTMIRPSTGFYDLFKKIVEDKQNEGTRKQYNQSWRVLNKKFPRLTYNQVDSEFFRKLVDYLENEKKYSRNNILKHIKRLREVMRRAYALGYTDNREYLTFRYSAESVKPVQTSRKTSY